MNIIDIKEKNSLQNAAKVLKTGGVLVFPTDTVYGIGSILNEETIKKLYKIKNRSLDKPTAILTTKEKLCPCLRYSNFKGIISAEFWTGKMTIIFPISALNFEIPEIITKDDTIGVRLPQYLWLENLINEVGPLATSSANKEGESTPKSFNELSSEIVDESDLVIKTNEVLGGKASTILYLEKNKILRP